MATGTMVAAPSSMSLEGIIDFSRDAEIHRHVLDVLSPVSGVGSQFLHLRGKDETRDDGQEVVETQLTNRGEQE